MAYNAGTAFLQIVPSFKGVVEQINAQASKWGDSAGQAFAKTFNAAVVNGTGKPIGPSPGDESKQGTQAGGAFADSFKARVTEAMKSLPDAKIDGDTTDADRKIAEVRAELASLSSARIGVDLSDDDALAKLVEIKVALADVASDSPSIRVKVDTAAAIAELAAVRGAADEAGGEGGGGLSGLARDALEGASGMSTLASAALALGPALVPIGALALGSLAAIPAVIAGAISGLGALKLGFSGVFGAISAFGKPATSSGPSAASQASQAISDAASIRNAANSVQSSQEALANAQVSDAKGVQTAQQNLADAQVAQANNVKTAQQGLATAQVEAADSVRSANEQLVGAEQSLASAEYNEQQAQEAVVAARQEAQRQLEDYTNQLADSKLAVQQAQLDIITAKQALDAANAPGSGQTSLQQQQAQLTYEQAVQRLKDLQTQNQQLTQDASAAAAAGVNGNQQVLNAEHSLSDAKQTVSNATQAQTDAQNALTAAQVAGSAKIIAAEQAIADAENQGAASVGAAQAALTQAQLSGAQQVADAERGYQQALAAQQDSLAQVKLHADSAGSSTKSFAQDMAGLTPAGRAFVTFVTGTLLPIFDGLKSKVQEALLPGVTSGLKDALPIFSVISGFIVGAGKGIGDFVSGLGQFLGSKEGIKDTTAIFQSGAGFMQAMGKAALLLLQAFGGIGAKAGPVVDHLAGGFVDIAKSFEKWATGGGFQKFLDWLQKNGPGIAKTLEDFVKAMGGLLTAAVPVGEAVLRVLDPILRFVAALVTAHPLIGDIAVGFAVLLGVVGLVAGPIAAIAGLFVVVAAALGITVGALALIVAAVVAVVVAIVLLVTHWGTVWATIKQVASDAWQWIDRNLFQPIITFFTSTLPGGLAAAVRFFAGLPGQVGSALASLWRVITGAFGNVSGWVGTNVIAPVVGWFAGLPGSAGRVLSGLFGAITRAFGNLGTWVDQNAVEPVVNLFANIGQRISNVASGMWDGIKDAFHDALQAIADMWNSLHFTIPGFDHFGIKFGGFTLGVPTVTIPKFHTGGTVPGAPGQDVLSMLQAGEVVLSRQQVAAATSASPARGLLDASSRVTGGPTNLQVDGRTFARLLFPYFRQEGNGGTGRNAVRTWAS